MHDRHAVLITAALLAVFVVTALILPAVARDFALVVLAMSTMASVLFFWSRRASWQLSKQPGTSSDSLNLLWPDSSAQSASSPETGYAFLCRTVCALSGASLAGVLVLDDASGHLLSDWPWVAKTSKGYRDVTSDFRVNLRNASDFEGALRSGQTRIVDSEPFDSLLRSLPGGLEMDLWAVPLVHEDREYGVLVVGVGAGGFHQHADAYLAALSAFAARIVASETMRDVCASQLSMIAEFCRGPFGRGTHVSLSEARTALLDALQGPFDTDMVALFEVDARGCCGDYNGSPAVSPDVLNAFQETYASRITDPDFRDSTVESIVACNDSDIRDSCAVSPLNSINSILICPIRARSGINGVLVGFYRDECRFPKERLTGLEVVSGLAASVLSYAAAMEQSGNLVDDLAGVNQELSLQVTIDGLTGLANHRTFHQTLSEMCRTAKSRPGGAFGLMMIDADHFKVYNDTHGHREGDAALREIAGLISSDLRQGDLAARYGGEEFAIIVQGIGKQIAAGVADRIRRRVAQHRFRRGSISISIGISEYPGDGSDAAELIERADKALYHAKVTGRNRVVTWGCASVRPVANSPQPAVTAARTVLMVAQTNDDCSSQGRQDYVSADCEVTTCPTIEAAAYALTSQAYDMAVVDIEVLTDKTLVSIAPLTAVYPDMPVVLLADNPSPDVVRNAMRYGIYDVLSKPIDREELTLLVERTVERRRHERTKLSEASTAVMLQAIEALAAAIDSKDHCTSGHSKRVTSIALMIAEDLELSNEDRYALELAAKIHDIGKIALPDSALNKQSALTNKEWEAMRNHPALGSKIVDSIDELAYVSSIIRHHHERLDGSGYPDGLRGGAIPYLSLVIAVADSYEAMTSERAHRSRMTPAEAIEELKSYSGLRYPVELVAILEKKLRETGEINSTQQLEAA